MQDTITYTTEKVRHGFCIAQYKGNHSITNENSTTKNTNTIIQNIDLNFVILN